MGRLQVSLRTFLLIVALVAGYFPCERIYRTWLARNYNFSHANLVLEFELRDGDTLNVMKKHFDETRLLTPADTEMENINNLWAMKKLTIKDGDQLFEMSMASGACAYLQFRDGQLVNLWRCVYIKPGQLSDPRNSGSIQSIFARFGALPFYAPLASLVLLANLYVTRRR